MYMLKETHDATIAPTAPKKIHHALPDHLMN